MQFSGSGADGINTKKSGWNFNSKREMDDNTPDIIRAFKSYD